MMNALQGRSVCMGRTLCVLLALPLLSCGSAPVLTDDPIRGGNRPEEPVHYSVVFLIHGDGDYLYHDEAGRPLEADEVTLSRAQRAAEESPQAEVFIFHQKKKKHAWLVFPTPDGEFFYYRNGRLTAHERYRRNPDPGGSFAWEAEQYRRFGRGGDSGAVRIVFYFGHEIPEIGGEGYHASDDDVPFTIDTLAAWLHAMQGRRGPFDIVVLSTCYNGTPYSISAVAPYARYIIASPDNLHLSYFTFHTFGSPDGERSGGTIAALATTLARDAFDTLSRTVQTAVSVAVYDAGLVQPYLHSVDSLYQWSLSVMKERPAAAREHCDCARIPGYVQPAMRRGVEVYYRPPRFGQRKTTLTHSGWECWNVTAAP